MVLTSLHPERHPKLDFFVPQIFDKSSFKDDIASMEYPIFTIQRQDERKTISYQKGNAAFELHASPFGLPNIYDKDVLVYCASMIMDKINRKEPYSKTMRISVRDFLIKTRRKIGGTQYEQFKSSLDRLTGCMLKTTIKTGRTTQINAFHLIDNYNVLEKSHKGSRYIRIELTLSDWFLNSLIANEVLTINPAYFDLTSPLARRLYEIARKHCGEADKWVCGLDKLYDKTGSVSETREFKRCIKDLCKKQLETGKKVIPDFEMYLQENNVVFINHNEKKMTKKRNVCHMNHVSEHALDKCRAISVERRLDFHAVAAEYARWVETLTTPIRNPEGHLIRFYQKKKAA
jgi:hypothetical protein